MPEGPARVLVTGGAGYIGSALVAKLLDLNEIDLVVSLDLARSSTYRQPLDQHASKKLVTIDQDIREPLAAVISEHNIDAVVHLAFLLRTHRDEAHARSINVEATGQLLKDVVETGVRRFVYLSSTTVYGASASNNRPFLESDETLPTPGFQYSQHKGEAERVNSRFANDHPDVKTTILRACPVMSPGASNFISDSLGMKFLPVPLGHDPELQLIHLDDLLTALVMGLRGENAAGLFNIAGEGTVRWRELARITGAIRIPVPRALLKPIISASWALRLQSKSPGPGLALITYPWLASTEKARVALGWKPEFTTRQTVEIWWASR
ncbi:MAG: NAD-dependent epimerase/dehydratase family protein [Chloroflexi bacterium]|nr:NAD-dependent epimerase/dehydratase family protein [Chloroflexota bacterium]